MKEELFVQMRQIEARQQSPDHPNFMECPGDVLFEILYFPGSLSCDLEAR